MGSSYGNINCEFISCNNCIEKDKSVIQINELNNKIILEDNQVSNNNENYIIDKNNILKIKDRSQNSTPIRFKSTKLKLKAVCNNNGDNYDHEFKLQHISNNLKNSNISHSVIYDKGFRITNTPNEIRKINDFLNPQSPSINHNVDKFVSNSLKSINNCNSLSLNHSDFRENEPPYN